MLFIVCCSSWAVEFVGAESRTTFPEVLPACLDVNMHTKIWSQCNNCASVILSSWESSCCLSNWEQHNALLIRPKLTSCANMWNWQRVCCVRGLDWRFNDGMIMCVHHAGGGQNDGRRRFWLLSWSSVRFDWLRRCCSAVFTLHALRQPKYLPDTHNNWGGFGRQEVVRDVMSPALAVSLNNYKLLI